MDSGKFQKLSILVQCLHKVKLRIRGILAGIDTVSVALAYLIRIFFADKTWHFQLICLLEILKCKT